MTYFQFHLVFTLPPLLLLAFVTYRALRSPLSTPQPAPQAKPGQALGQEPRQTPRFLFYALGLHVLLALVYTTPWDNYLIARGVWGYGEDRVLMTLGWVPLEEYLFFIIQTLLTGLWVLLLQRRVRVKPQALRWATAWRVVGALGWLGLAAAGVLALGTARGTYFGLIAAWAAPVLALQWGFGGDLLLRRPRVLVLAFAAPTLYLWLADRFALSAGIWWIAPEFSSGWQVAGLPLEEALFFLLTNLLVVFGMMLATEPAALPRLQALRQLSWWRVVLVLWAVSMVPTPLFPQQFPVFAYLSTGLLALGVLGYALARYGTRAWLLLVVAFGFGLAVEWLGHTTGFPFGAYRYTATGPQLLGVPLLVPLGWFAFALIALALAPPGRKVWLAPLALVAWDVGLDPLMVSQGFWQFGQGAYYGIPLSNFVGWAVAGLVLVTLLLRLEPRLAEDTPEDTPNDLRGVFWAQAFLISVGLLLFGLPWAALAALLAMGLVGALAAYRPAARGGTR